MDEDTARLKYWDGVQAIQDWIDNGPDSKEDVLVELEDDLKD